MELNPSDFHKLNVADTYGIWNILSSQLLYATANSAKCNFCCTKFVLYECLYKPRNKHKLEDIRLQIFLKKAICDGQFKSYDLSLEDLQEVDILRLRKKLGKGELSSIVFAKKTNQAFLTDDRGARKLAEMSIERKFVQTTSHLLGWLFFANYLVDGDLDIIIKQHKENKQSLEKHFRTMYKRALEYKSKVNIN